MKTYIKQFIIFCLFLITASPFFAQENPQQSAEEPNPFASADEKTKTILAETDNLIKQKKYETAFHHLGEKNENEYLIAKKIQICDDYFASSTMHQSFGFKDLAENETLNDARSNIENVPTIDFNPVKIVTDYETQNGTSAILEKSLGDYYVSVYNHYSGSWLSPDEEIVADSYKYYQLAYDKDCYDVDSLSNFGYACLQEKQYSKAIEVFQKLIAYADSANSRYNLAIAYMNISDYKNALVQANKAAEAYNDNPDYKTDAYLLCADALTYDNNTDEAEAYAKRVFEYSADNYLAVDELIFINLTAKKYDEAATYADKLFSLAPNSPGATQMIFRRYYANNKDELEKFFIRNLATYQGQPAVLGNLYYYLAYFYYGTNNKDKSVENANLAKNNFIDAGLYADNTKEAVDSLITECSSN